jgi:hypothetical protein
VRRAGVVCMVRQLRPGCFIPTDCGETRTLASVLRVTTHAAPSGSPAKPPVARMARKSKPAAVAVLPGGQAAAGFVAASMQRRIRSDFNKSTTAMAPEHMLMARYNVMLLECALDVP